MNRRSAANAHPVAGRRPAGLRLAAVLYFVVVLLGLAGTGAHALWSQSGTVEAGVTTGTWAPGPVSGNVTCTAHTGWFATSTDLDVIFGFPDDADSVIITVKDGAGTTRTQTVSRGTTTGRARATLNVESPWLTWADRKFTLTLTSSYKGEEATPLKPTLTWTRELAGYSATCR